jgi:hypothetical protein
MISPVLGGETGRPIRGDETAKRRRRPHKRSVVRSAVSLVVGEPFASISIPMAKSDQAASPKAAARFV